MIVRELIEKLQKCPQDYIVEFDNFDIVNVEIYNDSKLVNLE
jgi:uncharacterized protein YkuJ